MKDIVQTTRDYEAWLAARLTLVPEDLELKHQHMAEGAFPFLRATFYRWVQTWPATCPDLAAAPTVLAVGDLHMREFRHLAGRRGPFDLGHQRF